MGAAGPESVGSGIEAEHARLVDQLVAPMFGEGAADYGKFRDTARNVLLAVLNPDHWFNEAIAEAATDEEQAVLASRKGQFEAAVREYGGALLMQRLEGDMAPPPEGSEA